jgi:hypothetical protein
LLTEHTAPELLYLESKWSSLISYGLTVKALGDFLPTDARLSATSVRRNTLRVARRCERDLHTHDDAVSRAVRPRQDAPGVVGIDGGYLRHWEHKRTHFVTIVGKSVPIGGEARCFGFVQRTKWSLWHRKPKPAARRFREVEWRIWQFGPCYRKFSAPARAVNGFLHYIDRNASTIPDYGARWRAGQVISTGLIESLVNSLLSRHFAKKQSMRWTPEGAHLLLQIRTRTLNGDLTSTFRNRYRDFSVAEQPVQRHFLAA